MATTSEQKSYLPKNAVLITVGLLSSLSAYQGIKGKGGSMGMSIGLGIVSGLLSVGLIALISIPLTEKITKTTTIS